MSFNVLEHEAWYITESRWRLGWLKKSRISEGGRKYHYIWAAAFRFGTRQVLTEKMFPNVECTYVQLREIAANYFGIVLPNQGRLHEICKREGYTLYDF